jgi:prepilin-type N-terminal cleavage/methylation domain-containing protein
MKSLPRRSGHWEAGFSLIEIAVVLVIISVLVSVIAVPLSAQVEQRRVTETGKRLEIIKEALIGFASAKGRLPCPATDASAGQERFCVAASGACTSTTAQQAHGRCEVSFGRVPAVTLGISPLEASGFIEDAWSDGNVERRIRYAVSNYQNPANFYVLTAANGIKTNTMATTIAATHLYVCSTGLTAAPPVANCGVSVTTLTDRAPAVLVSLGKDSAANSNDELNNQNNDIVFSSGSENATFDDIVTWVSLNALFARMVQAGTLP